jgi:endonuclease YncB( thermonuclease family)
VIDGGTLRIDRQVVRLLGVDPPPRGESCGGAADCGSAAANALAVLVREKPVSCALHGQDRMGRPLGACDAAGTDLNRAQVAAGWARAGTARPDLRQAESSARAERIGLWAGTER